MLGKLPWPLLFACIALESAICVAQPYPSEPIRLVVPQAPAGPTDIVARAFGQALGEKLQQPVVVVNHGGAGGTIGADMVATAPADGYTLLMGGLNTLVLVVPLRADLPYDPIKSFVAIGEVARVPYALAVNPTIPAKTVQELIAYARANPGRLNYGSSGTGGTSNLATEMLKAAARVDIEHVPYSGLAPAVAALVAGQIDVVFADLALLAPHARAGTVRILGLAGGRRAAAAPDLPTVAEQGFPGFDVEAWYGLVAPAGTPADVVAKLKRALAEVLRSTEYRKRLESLGYEQVEDNAIALDAKIKSDIERYSAIVKRANIKPAP